MAEFLSVSWCLKPGFNERCKRPFPEQFFGERNNFFEINFAIKMSDKSKRRLYTFQNEWEVILCSCCYTSISYGRRRSTLTRQLNFHSLKFHFLTSRNKCRNENELVIKCISLSWFESVLLKKIAMYGYILSTGTLARPLLIFRAFKNQSTKARKGSRSTNGCARGLRIWSLRWDCGV